MPPPAVTDLWFSEHGMPDESPKGEDIQKDKLSNRLISMYRVYRSLFFHPHFLRLEHLPVS